MKNLQEITLLNGAGALNAAGSFDMLKEEDHFIIMPVTAGGTVSMTLVVELLNPDGVSWHQVATATYNAAGVQAPIQLSNYFGRSIRARLSAWANGTVTVRGFAGKRG